VGGGNSHRLLLVGSGLASAKFASSSLRGEQRKGGGQGRSGLNFETRGKSFRGLTYFILTLIFPARAETRRREKKEKKEKRKKKSPSFWAAHLDRENLYMPYNSLPICGPAQKGKKGGGGKGRGKRINNRRKEENSCELISGVLPSCIYIFIDVYPAREFTRTGRGKGGRKASSVSSREELNLTASILESKEGEELAGPGSGRGEALSPLPSRPKGGKGKEKRREGSILSLSSSN